MCDYTKILELCTLRGWSMMVYELDLHKAALKNVSRVPSLPCSLAHVPPRVTLKLCPQLMGPDGTWPSTHSPHLPPCFLAPHPLTIVQIDTSTHSCLRTFAHTMPTAPQIPAGLPPSARWLADIFQIFSTPHASVIVCLLAQEHKFHKRRNFTVSLTAVMSLQHLTQASQTYGGCLKIYLLNEWMRSLAGSHSATGKSLLLCLPLPQRPRSHSHLCSSLHYQPHFTDG